MSIVMPLYFVLFLGQLFSQRAYFKVSESKLKPPFFRYLSSPYGALISALALSLMLNILVTLQNSGNMMLTLGVSMCAISVSWILMLFVRKYFPYSDPILIPVTVFLSGIGVAMQRRLFPLTPEGNKERVVPENVYDFVVQSSAPGQILHLVLGVVSMGILLFSLAILRRREDLSPYYFPLQSLVLVSLIFLISRSISMPADQHSSVVLSIFGRFQLVELLKILSLLASAAYLSRFGHLIVDTETKNYPFRLPRIPYFLVFFLYYLLILGVVLSVKDLGTLLLITVVTTFLFFDAVREPLWLVVASVCGVLAVIGAYFMQPHFRGRVQVWLDPYSSINAGVKFSDPFQIIAGKSAALSGGLTGTGIGENGTLQHVPLVYSDMIPVAFSAEFGVVGILAIFLCLAVLAHRVVKVACQTTRGFVAYFLLSLGLLLFVQVILIFGGVYGFLPLTGQVLPFLARGGASLVSFWILVAILVHLTHTARENSPVNSIA